MSLRILCFVACLHVTLIHAQGSVKKGVAHWADSYMCDDFKVLNVSWWFDFRMNFEHYNENDICTSTINNYKQTHVPMVWGHWKKTKIRIADEAQYILGFNEPNHKKQANMSPERAAAAWTHLEKASKRKPLVSPSAANCGSHCITKDPFEWFDKFFKLCKDCRVDYIATHAYWCNVNRIMGYLKDLYNKYKRKIWLTEFACAKTTSEDVQLNFMKKLLPELEEAPFVDKYAWFSARLKKSGFITTAASLLEPNSSTLTRLGRFYNDFQWQPGAGVMNEVSTSDRNKPTPTKLPDIKSTPADISRVGRNETILILRAFTSNPTRWRKIFGYIRQNRNQLPEAVAVLYMSAKKRDLKPRIQAKFDEILCTDLQNIEDTELRALVATIQTMSKEKNKEKKKKKGGKLRMPSCSTT